MTTHPVTPEERAKLAQDAEKARARLRPRSWRPSAADHHDRQEDCGEIECARCNPHDASAHQVLVAVFSHSATASGAEQAARMALEGLTAAGLRVVDEEYVG